jgi:stage II sporulation protein AA (anti-sigma F factor antagonist)
MEEEWKVIDDCLCIRMPEEVDHHVSEEICRNADHVILESRVNQVVFDFEDTRFMDSSGIGILIGRYKLMSCFGGKVYVIHPDKQIRRMLEMSGMQKMVEIL